MSLFTRSVQASALRSETGCFIYHIPIDEVLGPHGT